MPAFHGYLSVPLPAPLPPEKHGEFRGSIGIRGGFRSTQCNVTVAGLRQHSVGAARYP